MNYVTEIVLFRLNPNDDEIRFLEDAQATFDLLTIYEGFIDRDLSVTEDGLWVDIVTWADMDTALSAAEQIMESPIGQAFGAHINPETIQMNHTVTRLGHRKAV